MIFLINIRIRGKHLIIKTTIMIIKRKIIGEKIMLNNSKLTKTQIATLKKAQATLKAVNDISSKNKMKDYLINFVSVCEEHALSGCLHEDNEYILTLIFKEYVLKKHICSSIQVCEHLDEIIQFKYLNLINRFERYIKGVKLHAPQTLIASGNEIIENSVATVRVINYFINLYFDGE